MASSKRANLAPEAIASSIVLSANPGFSLVAPVRAAPLSARPGVPMSPAPNARLAGSRIILPNASHIPEYIL